MAFVQHIKIPRTAALSVAGPATLLVLGYLFWSIWGARALDRSYFALKLENLRVSPQPVWIKTPVTQEVFEGSFLKDVSLQDRNAASTIAHAFDLHPWVRKTTRVTKVSGGEVWVDLEYRQPVALVMLDPSTPNEKKRSEEKGWPLGQWRFLPLDAESVILPSEPPETYRTDDYLLVYTKGATTNSHVGQPFGDSRILQAVKLCVLLNPLRRELDLDRIYVQDVVLPSGRKDYALDVATRKTEKREQRRVVWGHAPGSEVPGELDTKIKLQRLYQFFASEEKGLDSIDVSGLSR